MRPRLKERLSGACRKPRAVHNVPEPIADIASCYEYRPLLGGVIAGTAGVWQFGCHSIQDLMGLQYEGCPEAVPVFDCRLSRRAQEQEASGFQAYVRRDWNSSNPWEEQHQLAALREQLYDEQYSLYAADLLLQQRSRRISQLEASLQLLEHQATHATSAQTTQSRDIASLLARMQGIQGNLQDATSRLQAQTDARIAAEQLAVANQVDAANACVAFETHSASLKAKLRSQMLLHSATKQQLHSAEQELQSERAARLAAELTTIQEVAAAQVDAASACSVIAQQSASRLTALMLQRQRRQQAEEQLQAMTSARDAAEQRAAQAVATSTAAQQAVTDLQAELTAAKAALSDSRASEQASSQQLEQAVAHGQQMGEQLATAQAEHSDAEERNQQTSQALRSELAEVQSELAQTKDALELSQAQEAVSVHDMQDAKTDARQLQADLQKAQTDLSVAQQQLSRLSQDVADNKAEHTQALERLQESTLGADQLKAELQSSQRHLSTAQQQLTLTADDLLVSKAEQQQTLERVEQASSAASQLQAQLDTAQDERQSALTSLAQLQQTLEHSQQQLSRTLLSQAATQEQLVASQANSDTLSGANSQLEASKAGLSQDLAASQAQQQQTLERLEESNSTASQLQAKLETAETDLESAVERNAKLQQTLEQASKTATEFQDSEAAAQQQLEVSRAACDNLTALSSQLETSTAELVQNLQASEAEKQTALEVAAERQTLLADAQAQLQSVTSQQEATAQKVTKLQQRLKEAQQSNELLSQQRESAQTQLESKEVKHADAQKSIQGLQSKLASLKENAKVKQAEASVSAKLHKELIAELQTSLATERSAAESFKHSSQRQQQADSDTIGQLQAALNSAQESAKTKADQADAAVKGHSDTIASLRSDLAASQQQVGNLRKGHADDLGKIQRLQNELIGAEQTARTVQEDAAAATKVHEANIAALRKDLRQQQQQQITKDVARAASPPPGFGGPVQRAGGAQQGSLSVKTGAVQPPMSHSHNTASQDNVEQPPGLARIRQAKPSAASGAAQSNAAQEVFRSSSLSSVASSSSLGPATPQEPVSTAFSRGHPGKYEPPGTTRTAGQAPSVTASSLPSSSSQLAQSAALPTSGGGQYRPRYEPPSGATEAAGSSVARGSNTGRTSGGGVSAAGSSQGDGTGLLLHAPQAGITADSSKRHCVQQAQVPKTAASDAAAAAARAVNGLDRALDQANGSSASSSQQRSGTAAKQNAARSWSQRRNSSSGHAEPTAATAGLPPGLYAQAVTTSSTAGGRGTPSAANAANRLPGTVQGSSAQPRQPQQARQSAAAGGHSSLSQAEAQQLQKDHVKPLVGPVVKVDNWTEDDTHRMLCTIARQQGWRCYTDVRGDGNCGYRAVGLGLVVAMAQLQPRTRHMFVQHLEQMYSRMQQFPQLLTGSSPTQGSVLMGFEALLEGLQLEPGFRRIMDGSVVPSQQLINHWNQGATSDAVVLFLRALTAFYMLQHPAFYEAMYMVDLDRPKTLEEACLMYVCPFCPGSGVKDAEVRGADAYSTLIALAEALKVDILVQPANGSAINVLDHCQRTVRSAWQKQISLICKPGHFAVAWA